MSQVLPLGPADDMASVGSVRQEGPQVSAMSWPQHGPFARMTWQAWAVRVRKGDKENARSRNIERRERGGKKNEVTVTKMSFIVFQLLENIIIMDMVSFSKFVTNHSVYKQIELYSVPTGHTTSLLSYSKFCS